MKYARIERERRFLLAHLPRDLSPEFHTITDWYIENTRLRLRRVAASTGEQVSQKLTQKYLTPESAGRRAVITNIYLDPGEFELLRSLGGRMIQKKRFRHRMGLHRFAVDEFCGRLEGLLLAEIEFDDDSAMNALAIPNFAVAEVTSEPFFTGANLARLEADALRREMIRWLPHRA